MNLHVPKTANVLGFFLSKKHISSLKKYFIFFFCISFIFFSLVKAQSNVSLMGQVNDSLDGFPLANVLIQVKGKIFETYSNPDGYFEIENMQPGKYMVRFTLIGYETKTIQNIIISEDITARVLVELKKKILMGETIAVDAEHIEKGTDMGGDKIVINLIEERKSGNKSIKKVLQQVAGLEVVSTGSGENNAKISIHGSDANQVLVLLDGKRLNNSQTGDVDLNEIPFEEVEKIEVVRQGNTAMYGSGAYAGVVNFKTSQNIESAYISIESNVGSFSTYSGRIAGGTPIGTGFLRANYYQDYSNQNYPYEYKDQKFNRENAWYRNRNFYTKLNYRLNSHHFSLGLSQRKINQGLPSANFNEQLVYGAKVNESSRRVLFDYKWLHKQNFYIDTFSGYSYLDQVFDNSRDPSPFTKYQNNFINTIFEVQSTVNYQFSKFLITKLGFQYFKESLKQKNLIYPDLSSGKNSRETRSVFTGFEYNLSDLKLFWSKAKLFSAARYQKHFNQKAEIYPSIGFSLTPINIEPITISGSWAKSVRYPDFNSLFWKGGVQSQGNPDLLPEKKNSRSVGLALDFKKKYSPNIYVFYFSEELTDLIFWEQIRNNQWQPRNLTAAEKDGWDIQLKQKIYANHLSLRAAYSRVNAKNKTDEPTIFDKLLTFIPKHTATASLQSNFYNINLMISFRYVSERQTVKANTAKPLNEYRIWDASLNYIKKVGDLSINFEVSGENLMGQQYQLLRGYPMPSKVVRTAIQLKYEFKKTKFGKGSLK